MYKHLYDKFQNWFHENRGGIYFYGDPHFGDTYMANYREISDEDQVLFINSKIGKYDTLVILGDVGDPKVFEKIHGYKVLVKGNHDKGNEHYAPYFNEIYEGPVFVAEKLLISHEPFDTSFAFNIHGHSHFPEPSKYNMFNACAEHIGYHPVSLRKIIESGAVKNIDSIHRQTIDAASARKAEYESKV